MMRIDVSHSHPKKRPTAALIIWCLFGFFSATASAQVTFVHITDPHVFDDNWVDKDPTKTEDNRLDNQAALASCLWNINESIKKGSKYDFGVITGDLGIEFLVQDVDRVGENAVGTKLEKAASDFASMLALSGVSKWLVVPGNNDVLCEDPRNVRYYHTFIAAVRSALAEDGKVSIVDLCPQDNSNFSRSDVFQINGYSFIGFNDSSFKNDPKTEAVCTQTNRIDVYANFQKNYVIQVEELLK